MKTYPDFEFERCHSGIVAGLDEAGCGPWAGPLVAAAVVLPNVSVLPSFINAVNDSKQLSKNSREYLFELITDAKNIDVGVGIVSALELDELLLKNAIPRAFERAVNNLKQKPDCLLIDGIRNPKLPYLTTMIKGGDGRSMSIAAASIIAKVTRDRIMEQLHADYPVYGWNTNAGYGTKAHQKALQEWGVTPQHRRSYAPIKALLAA